MKLLVVSIGVSSIISFSFGYFIAKPKPLSPAIQPKLLIEQAAAPIETAKIKLPENLNQHQQILAAAQDNASLKWLLKTASKVLPNHEINDVLSSFFSSDELLTVNNPSQFSQRLIDELTEDNHTPNLLNAEMRVSLKEAYPQSSVSNLQVSPYDRIFIHIQMTNNDLQINPSVFIKWKNTDTQEILLFDSKSINPTLPSNWISLIPDAGWLAGMYSITAYQLNDELSPIASLSYYLSVSDQR